MDLILGSSNPDANVRAMAVKALVNSVAGKELSDIEDMVRLSGYPHFQLLILM
jgi:hypothetical protein